MGALTPTLFVTLTDLLAAGFQALKGTAGSGFGAGDATLALGSDWGVSRAARDFKAAALSSGDLPLITALLIGAGKDFDTLSNYRALTKSLFYRQIGALERACGKEGLTNVRDLPSFAAYYATGAGGPHTALVHPSFAEMYALAIFGKTVAPTAVFSPPIASMASRAIGAAMIDGTNVDATKYAGVFAAVTTTGGAYGGGGGNVLTVTGTARDGAGVTQTGRTFTATVAANGTFTLTPTVSGDLLLTVTGITLPSVMTAGTATVVGQMPAGRSMTPAA